MKTNKKKVIETKWKAKAGISPLSNIKIRVKVFIVALVYIFSVLGIFLIVEKKIYESSEKTADRMEKSVVAAADQYIYTSVDTVVSVANTLYSNKLLYDFISKKYKDSSDYYESFYELENHNSLLVADIPIIQDLGIYTENDTILSGGNFFNLNKYKETEWYNYVKKINKNMTLYCDSEKGIISFIRKLDFYAVNTGEAYLKIDLSSVTIRDFFEGIDFDGNLMIKNGGMDIFSNVRYDEKEKNTVNNDYYSFVKNYYTCDIEYYACQKPESFIKVVFSNVITMVFIIIIIVLTLIAAVCIFSNITVRIRKLNALIKTDNGLDSINVSSCGKDEIGELYINCKLYSEKLGKKNREVDNFKSVLRLRAEQTDNILYNALTLDYNIFCGNKLPPLMKKFELNLFEQISIRKEIEIMEYIAENDFFDNVENTNISIEYEESEIPDIKVMPMLLSSVLVDALKRENEGMQRDISVVMKASETRCTTTFTSSQRFEPRQLLKLQAIFEKSSMGDTYAFEPENPFNPYYRMREFYKGDIDVEALIDESGSRLSITIYYDMM